MMPALARRESMWPPLARFGALPLFPLSVVVVFILAAVFADAIAFHDPIVGSLRDRLRPPVWQSGGSWTFPLGTDDVGRDIFTRTVFGARASLVVASLTLALGAGVGSAIGMVSGYFGGRTDAFFMRLADITMGFPILLLALLLAVTRGPGLANVVFAISFILWARFARVIRAEVLSLRERDFIKLARVAGASSTRVLGRHILPNVANTIAVLASLQLGSVIILEASLSFLGAGIAAPTPAWGSMTASGREYVTTAYWVPLVPGAAIMLSVLAFNMLGDWLRDNLDPKLRTL